MAIGIFFFVGNVFISLAKHLKPELLCVSGGQVTKNIVFIILVEQEKKIRAEIVAKCTQRKDALALIRSFI